MIEIINYNVGQADCLLIHFEEKADGGKEKKENRYFNLLIDGGYAKDEIEKKVLNDIGEDKIQGVVVSHIDADHIAGILRLAKNGSAMIENAFLVFNEYDENLISYSQARDLAKDFKKNFRGNCLVRSYSRSYSEEDNKEINSRIDNKKMISVKIMSFNQRKKIRALDYSIINITMLGPNREMLQKFMRNWYTETINPEVINASSVMILIEFEQKAILMSGDGYFSEIEEKLQEINIDRIDVIKASHHGAKKNNSKLIDIAQRYNCSKILFTISGDEDKKHPDLGLVEDLSKNRELLCSANITCEKLKEYMKQQNKIIV